MVRHTDGTVTDWRNVDKYKNWTDIVDVVGDSSIRIGIKSDGTILIDSFTDAYEKQGVGGWTDIVALETNGGVASGVRSDGTILAAVDNTTIHLTDEQIAESLKTIRQWRVFNTLDDLKNGMGWYAGPVNGRRDRYNAYKQEKQRQEIYQKELEINRKKREFQTIIDEKTRQINAKKEELSRLKGFFTGKKRAELEGTIVRLEKEIEHQKKQMGEL
jgi:hypothetical protein